MRDIDYMLRVCLYVCMYVCRILEGKLSDSAPWDLGSSMVHFSGGPKRGLFGILAREIWKLLFG